MHRTSTSLHSTGNRNPCIKTLRQFNYAVSLACALLIAGCSDVSVTELTSANRLAPENGEPHDYFGYAVDLSDDRAIIGAYGDDDRGENVGAAYIFKRRGTSWKEEGKLTPRPAIPSDQFGIAVAIEGDHAFVGTRGDIENDRQSGRVYIFRWIDGSWTETRWYRSSTPNTDDAYGRSVDVNGSWAAIGAHGDSKKGRDAGAVYLYQLRNESWGFHSRLLPPKGEEADYFGFDVSVFRDRLLVGAFGDDEKGIRAGAAYVFRLSNDEWKLEQKLVAPGGGGRHQLFGHSVALTKLHAVIGSHGYRSRGKFSGAAFVYQKTAKGWQHQTTLEAGDPGANKYFGFDVAAAGNRILVGARGDRKQAGAAYLYRKTGETWTALAKLVSAEGAELDFLGRAVAIAEGSLLIGVHGSDEKGSMSGSVYAGK
jgi:hypothetical protein